jgi:demethylmenaquinone methyltransferase/2-methoxy-6-polyprenyl-1,4-benzoquinol methylase
MDLDKSSDKISGMFDSIAENYDKANFILSLGTFRSWYRLLIKELNLKGEFKLLDCATGTGNLTFEFAKKYPQSRITGIDFSPKMLEIARRRGKDFSNISFVPADIINLPFISNSFDSAVISYGIRNVEDTRLGLAGIARVVKPCGLIGILEFGNPNPVIGKLYDIYRKILIPPLGWILTGNHKAYSYLASSTKEFPFGSNFISLALETNCFSNARYRKIFGGIVYIYILQVRGD